jgi:signal transduction histidine kinase
MIQDTRSLTFELSVPVLYELGFEAAVEWFAKHIRTQHGLQVEFTPDTVPIPVDDELKVLLFRSVRELMINIVKHAQARHAWVNIIRRNDGRVCIEVKDDGVGINGSQGAVSEDNGRGFGLFSIRERLHYLGGGVDVVSGQDAGTQVTLMLPLDYAKKSRTRKWG